MRDLHTLNRRRFAGVLVAAPLVVTPDRVRAQAFPSKPVKIIVPFAPGGPTDTSARITGEALARELGVAVVVDNVPGAGAAIGTLKVATSTPDGYTLLWGTPSSLTVAPSVRSDLKYDALTSFAPISLVASAPFVLVVKQGLGVTDLAGLIELARSRPGQLNYGSTGIAGSAHMLTELFLRTAGIQATHIPYSGGAPMVGALRQGAVDFLFDTPTTVAPVVQAGAGLALAVTSAARWPELPQVKSLAELGMRGFDVSTWFGLLAPAGTPAEALRTLSDKVMLASRSDAVRKALQAAGFIAVGSSPGEFTERIRSEGRGAGREHQGAMSTPGLQPSDMLRDDSGSDFWVHRDIYRDPQVFEWEMQYLFEGGWNLLGLEAQLPRPLDFFTTTIGRTPVIVTRDAGGVVHAVINSCRHKGALVCHHRQGNARHFVCQYHGWAYEPSGKNILVKLEKEGAYSPCFAQQDHNLVPVARLGIYRGLIFGSLNPDVPELDEHLGDLRTMIDLIVDQSPQGIECIPGRSSFVYKGNWKLQLENGVDPYHFSTTHTSYIQALQQRESTASVYANFKSSELQRGTFAFGRGHNAMWGPAPSGNATPLSHVHDELAARVGNVRAKWMAYVRNITVFPNAQFAENASLQLRIWRPLAVDRTEMVTYCLAPVGEPAAARRLRIRQYEEFFNPTGLATPDDIVNYEDCQRGMAARGIAWQQGHARGQTLTSGAVPAAAAELGLSPVAAVVGSFNLGDETVMHATYRHWRDQIQQGLERDRAAQP
jgi:tripartite-type tricarboxylate transporter receptor subunit TctC/phenylpropionate dioxygenase-like ring-hydroxylating dioxygenase large terminal subunit